MTAEDRLLAYLPAAFALVLVLPRLLSAHFGFFDDAVTLRVAGQLADGDWSVLTDEAATGRFRPTYWLQYGLVYSVAGARPTWYFLWNGVLLGVLTALSVRLVRQRGGNLRQAWITGALLVVSGPVIENLYTSSKPELLQAVLLLAALVLGTRRRPKPQIWQGWFGTVFAQAMLFLLAITTKETALVMMPIGATWLALAILRSRRTDWEGDWYPAAALALAALLASVVYLALRSQYLPASLTAGTYSNNLEFSVDRLRDSAIRWAGWLVRDFAYLAPLSLVLVLGSLRRHLPTQGLVLGALVWTGAWIAVYLPWEFTVEYYMLPVAIGASLLGGAVLAAALDASPLVDSWRRAWKSTALGLAGLLWLTTLPNQYSNARQQLAVDEANAGMLEFLATEAPSGSRVLINIQQPNEYTYEIDLHLRELRNRADLIVETYDPSKAHKAIGREGAYLVLPFVRNQPLLAVRMGVIESTQLEWNRILEEEVGERLVPIYRVERGFRLTIIDLPRFLCPALQGRGYCQEQRPLIDLRRFSYGWDVAQLTPSAAP